MAALANSQGSGPWCVDSLTVASHGSPGWNTPVLCEWMGGLRDECPHREHGAFNKAFNKMGIHSTVPSLALVPLTFNTIASSNISYLPG